jgi:antitoxin ParD1/3/4
MSQSRRITISEDQADFVDAQVRAGRHADAGEVVREALRLYEDEMAAEQASIAVIERVAAEGAEAIARGDFVEVQSFDEVQELFAAIGEEAAAAVRARHRAA